MLQDYKPQKGEISRNEQQNATNVIHILLHSISSWQGKFEHLWNHSSFASQPILMLMMTKRQFWSIPRSFCLFVGVLPPPPSHPRFINPSLQSAILLQRHKSTCNHERGNSKENHTHAKMNKWKRDWTLEHWWDMTERPSMLYRILATHWGCLVIV